MVENKSSLSGFNMNCKSIIIFILPFFISLCHAQCQIASPDGKTPIFLGSPIGRNQIIISQDGNDIKYSVTVAGSKLILPSDLGLTFKDIPDANGYQITDEKMTSVVNTWTPVFGKRSKINNIYSQLELSLKPSNPKSIPLKLIFRAYEDGIAFRYIIDSKNKKQLTITKELSQFNFADDLSFWSYVPERPPLGPTPISHIDSTLNYPLLSESPGQSIALTEANLQDYPWAIFKSEKGKKDFTISLKKPVTIQLPFQFPWRVIMIGRSTGQLLDSDLIVNLNPKADPNDFAWLKPGLSFWDWRVTGYVAPDGFAYGMNLPTWKRTIDFASQTGITYLLLDANWYGPEFATDSDPFTGGYAKDVKKALDYGKSKNVRLILYLNHVAAKKYGIEKILKAYSDWGAAGIKYGFMRVSSPLEKVKWTHKVARLCAENHLLVNFHDAPIPPTGEEAYLPNFFNREFCHAQLDAKRVFGPDDFIKMIHVNMLAGPLDMNNGMFELNKAYPAGSERMPATLDSTILAEAARTFITYGGGVTVLPDAADSYKQHPDLFSFISRQKYPWTQSKTLDSKMPEYISMMRQSGDIYFVASATNESPRDLSIDLSFLPAGKTYKATIFSDTKTSHYQKDRMSYDVTTKNVTSKDKIDAHLAPGSGHCMIIEPQ